MLKKTVLEHYGTQQKVADALGIRQSAVSQWGEVVPKKSAYDLAFLTSGKLAVIHSMYSKKK